MKEGGGGLRRPPRHDSKSGVSWEGAPARARWFGNGLRSRGHNCRRLGRRPRCRFQNHRCHGQCPRSRGHPARSSRVSRCPRRNPPWKLSRGSETRVHREHSGQLGPPPARGSSRYSRAVRTSWIGWPRGRRRKRRHGPWARSLPASVPRADWALGTGVAEAARAEGPWVTWVPNQRVPV